MPGGFVGVDVFFVLSGFLITSLLAATFTSQGQIRLRDFYMRRLLRLYPALVLGVLLAAVLTAVMDLRWAVFALDALAALTYTYNFGLNFGEHSPLLGHFWSLAVEEQYYLVWPLVLIWMLRRGTTWALRSTVVAVVALALLKAALVPLVDEAYLYFLPFGHLDEMLVGSALGLALATQPSERLRSWLARTPLAWAARLPLGAVALLATSGTVRTDTHRFSPPCGASGLRQTAVMPTGPQDVGASVDDDQPTPTVVSHNADGRRLARNAFANYGSFIVQLALGLLVTPLLLSGLGEQDFGRYSVLLVLAGYVVTLELGLGTATVRSVASAMSGGSSSDALAVLVRTSTVMYYRVAACGAAILVGLTLALPLLAEDGRDSRSLLLVLGLAQVFSLLLNVYPAVMFGSGRFSTLSWATLLISVVTSLTLGVVAFTTGDLFAVVCVQASSSVVSAVVTRHIALAQFGHLRGTKAPYDRTLARHLFRSGSRNALLGLSWTLAHGMDLLVVSSMLSLSAAAAYGIGMRASAPTLALASRGADVLVPSYAHHAAVGDFGRLFDLYRRAVVVTWTLTLPCGLVIAFAGPGLLELWLGTPPEGSSSVLLLLVLSTVVAVPGANAMRLLSGIDRLTFACVGAFAAALLNLVASIVLTSILGLTGPAIATLAMSVCWELVVLPIYVCRVCEVSPRLLLSDFVRTFLLPLAATLALGVALLPLEQTAGWTLVRAGALAGVFLGATALCLGSEQRQRYLRLVRR